MAHNQERPSLPSIYALFGLSDRDQLSTILAKSPESAPHAEQRRSTPLENHGFYRPPHDAAVLTKGKSPYNDHNDHNNAISTRSETARHISSDHFYHRSERVSIPSSRVVQSDPFVIPQPTETHGILAASSAPMAPTTYFGSPHSRSDHYISPGAESSASSTPTKSAGKIRQHDLVTSRGRRPSVPSYAVLPGTEGSAVDTTRHPMASSGSSHSQVDKKDLGGRLVKNEDTIASWKVKLYNGGPFESVVWSHIGQSSKRPGKNSQTYSGGTSAATNGRYECDHCQKRFNRPSGLKIHLNTHTGDKPYPCLYPGCGRHFSVLSNMRRHSRCHPDSNQQLPTAVGVVVDDNDEGEDEDEDEDVDVDEDDEEDMDEGQESDLDASSSWTSQRSTQAYGTGQPIIPSNSPSGTHSSPHLTGAIHSTFSPSQPHPGYTSFPSSAINVPRLPNSRGVFMSSERYLEENRGGGARTGIATDTPSFRHPNHHLYPESIVSPVDPAAEIYGSGTSPLLTPHSFFPTAMIHERPPVGAEHRVSASSSPSSYTSRHQQRSYRQSYKVSHSITPVPSASSFANYPVARGPYEMPHGEQRWT